ncbi:hypothetical protein JAAARDRAFT_197254 [Jaapia argillacea MUCL 33604]|uniref:G domain-containing protein n=1 Tax=Jaapia argillacea MUCL 33604 TaxID=933084 RepID=A0A067PFX8_9AGAM|nr:hypothetical protein JAAARDRAFT_197254 [Jaapia argillacea MUCL 33604]
MGGSDLPSQAAEIIEECSPFRILVIGTTGVGKSTLINCTFKVEHANVSHLGAGKSNIDDEITFLENPLFILHDSQGLESGEVDNLNKIKDFVKRRMAEPKIKDRLHAVWLCIEVPRAGGRLFETGTEELLQLARDEQLPIVVVFTKFDMLLLRERNRLRGKLPKEEIAPAAEKHAELFYEERCEKPLAGLARNTCCVKVSYNDYASLIHLVEVTSHLVLSHGEEDVFIVWAIAQRVSAGLKLKASVTVGMKRYWKGVSLKETSCESGFQACLDAIHTDMVSVWNFNDPVGLLSSTEITDMILHLIEELGPTKRTTDPGDDLTTTNTTEPIAQAVLPVGGHVASAVCPSITFVKWLLNTYDVTSDTLKCQMAYIVDLIAILEQVLLLILAKPPQPIRLAEIQEAFSAYNGSSIRTNIHKGIRRYVEETDAVHHLDVGNTEKETSRLVRQYCGASILTDLKLNRG